MDWGGIGEWLSKNAGSGAALVGSLLTGNVPGAVAAGVSMVKSATGEDDPQRVLDSLQQNPETVVRLREIALENDKSIREHIEEMERIKLEHEAKVHGQTQETIRSGDNSDDVFVRRTRPGITVGLTIAFCIYIGYVTFKQYAINEWVVDLVLWVIMTYFGARGVDKMGINTSLFKRK